MAKSSGNIARVGDLLAPGVSARALRYALIAVHYRAPLELLATSRSPRRPPPSNGLTRVVAALEAYREERPDDPTLRRVLDGGARGVRRGARRRPQRVGRPRRRVRPRPRAQPADRATRSLSTADAGRALATLRDLDQVLGVLPDESRRAGPESPRLLEAREAARAARDWAASDRLRDELAALGVAVEDTRDGQRWRRIGRRTMADRPRRDDDRRDRPPSGRGRPGGPARGGPGGPGRGGPGGDGPGSGGPAADRRTAVRTSIGRSGLPTPRGPRPDGPRPYGGRSPGQRPTGGRPGGPGGRPVRGQDLARCRAATRARVLGPVRAAVPGSRRAVPTGPGRRARTSAATHRAARSAVRPRRAPPFGPRPRRPFDRGARPPGRSSPGTGPPRSGFAASRRPARSAVRRDDRGEPGASARPRTQTAHRARRGARPRPTVDAPRAS